MTLGAGRLLFYTLLQPFLLEPTTASLALTAPDPAIQGEALVSASSAQLVLTAPDPGVGVTAFEATTAEFVVEAPDPDISVAFPTYSNGYGYRIRIAVPTSSIQGGAAVADLPMLFYETLDPLKTLANGGRVNSASGWDIRVEDASGNKLSHDLAAYDGTTGETLLWIRVPSLSVSATNVLFLYYGKADLPATEANPSDCWKDYLAVWDARTGADRSGNSRDMTPTSVGAGTLIGDAGSYDGTISYALRNDASGIPWLIGRQTISVEAIVKSDVTSGKRGIISVVPPSGTDAEAAMFLAYLASTSIQFQWRNSSGSSYIVSATGKQVTTTQHITATWASGSMPQLYVDGVAETAPTAGGANLGTPLTATQSPLWLGVAPASSLRWDGLIDEVRIASVVLSAGRVATAYQNTRDRRLFYGYGAEDVSTTTTPSVVAVPMRATTTENVAVTIDVIAAAVVPAGAGSPTITIVAQGTLGTAAVVSNRIRYTPTTGTDGTDSFTYRLTANGKATTAKIEVFIDDVVTSTGWSWPELPWTSGGYLSTVPRTYLATLRTATGVGGSTITRPIRAVLGFLKAPGSGLWSGRDTAAKIRNGPLLEQDFIDEMDAGCPTAVIRWSLGIAGNAAQSATPSAWTVANFPNSKVAKSQHVSTKCPVGFWQNQTASNLIKVSLQMQVWEKMSQGWFDDVWTSDILAMKELFDGTGGWNTALPRRVVISINHEMNLRSTWRNPTGTNASQIETHSCRMIGGLNAFATDVALVKAAYSRAADLLHSLWPGVIVIFNPLRNTSTANLPHAPGSDANVAGAPGSGSLKIQDLCDPTKFDGYGPDIYDAGVAIGPNINGGTNVQRWNAWITQTSTGGSPGNIIAHYHHMRDVFLPLNPAMRFFVPEWGLYTKIGDNSSTNAGGDNDYFISQMWGVFKDIAAAGHMAVDIYYNDAISNFSDHQIKPAGASGNVHPNGSAMYATKWTGPL